MYDIVIKLNSDITHVNMKQINIEQNHLDQMNDQNILPCKPLTPTEKIKSTENIFRNIEIGMLKNA